MGKRFKTTAKINDLLRRSGSSNKEEALAATHELAKALELPLRKGVLDGNILNSIFEPIALEQSATSEFPLDFLTPGTEKEFVAQLETDARIKFFMKIPLWYFIETPAGKYSPDWVIIVERKNNGKSELCYYIVETKGDSNLENLRPTERLKILSAKKRFESIEKITFLAPIVNYDDFIKKWD